MRFKTKMIPPSGDPDRPVRFRYPEASTQSHALPEQDSRRAALGEVPVEKAARAVPQSPVPPGRTSPGPTPLGRIS